MPTLILFPFSKLRLLILYFLRLVTGFLLLGVTPTIKTFKQPLHFIVNVNESRIGVQLFYTLPNYYHMITNTLWFSSNSSTVEQVYASTGLF